MADKCLVHGNELHYDQRSGFELCYECEREKAAPAPQAEPTKHKEWCVFGTDEACNCRGAAPAETAGQMTPDAYQFWLNSKPMSRFDLMAAYAKQCVEHWKSSSDQFEALFADAHKKLAAAESKLTAMRKAHRECSVSKPESWQKVPFGF